jgi:L-asparaginase/Glu-tRNA(Gln) amidotransferase subunit D
MDHDEFLESLPSLIGAVAVAIASAFILWVVAITPAHAGGLLNGLGNMGAIAGGYMNPYQAYQLQQLYLQQQQLQALQNLQNSYQNYQFPNGQRLNCFNTGQFTRCY